MDFVIFFLSVLRAILYCIFVWITEYCIRAVIRILRAGNYIGLDRRLLTILQTFYSRVVIQRTIVDFPAFLEHGLAEKIAVSVHTSGSGNRSESWEWLE